mgnify:CR=1 FL=1|jgi:CBS domain-containing protein
MSSARRLLQVRKSMVWSVKPDTPLLDALKLMANKSIGALIVLVDGKLVGILSERDYARKVALEGRDENTTLVRDIMSPKVITVHPEQTIQECMALMEDHHIRHLPVVEKERVIGIISLRDVVRDLLYQQSLRGKKPKIQDLVS